MISMLKAHMKAIADFFSSIAAGQSPQVQSASRKAAFRSLMAYVKCSGSSVRFSNKAMVKRKLMLGSAGITTEMQEEGYFATICSQLFEPSTPEEGYVTQDLHVTKAQLEGLYSQIGNMLDSEAKN